MASLLSYSLSVDLGSNVYVHIAGKSLYVNRLHENLKMKLADEKVPLKIIRLTDPHVDESRVLSSLLPFLKRNYQKTPMIFHIDVSTSVSVLASLPNDLEEDRFPWPDCLLPPPAFLVNCILSRGKQASPQSVSDGCHPTHSQTCVSFCRYRLGFLSFFSNSSFCST